MHRQATNNNRVAIGGGTSGATDTDAPVRSTGIFDDYWLSKRVSHPLGDDSSNGVITSARREWYDHGNRARRIGLRRCNAQECGSDHSGPGELQEFSTQKFHGASRGARLLELAHSAVIRTPSPDRTV